MNATMQPRLVNSASVSSNAKATQTQSASRPVSAPKAGTRFLGFLMSALGVMAV